MPADIKYEFYIDTDSTGDIADLDPCATVTAGLNCGVSITNQSGGITFDEAGYLKGGKTGYDVGTGFWLGLDTSDYNYKVAVGDPADEKITWDGADLNIDIDAANLTINGGTAGQALSVDSNGTVTFIDTVENLDDLGDVTGTTYSASTYKVLIPQSGNVYGFSDLRSVTDAYVRLRDLTDVSNTAASTNQILVYNGTNWAPTSTLPSNAISLNFEDLNNAAPNTPQDNDVWRYSTSNQLWMLVQFSLNSLADTNASSPTNLDMLRYNSTTLKWEKINSTTLLGSQTLNNHTDVSLSSPATNDVLQYNGTNWVNADGDIFPYELAGTNGTGGPLGADPKLSLLNGNNATRGVIQFSRGAGIEITRSGNTFEFSSTAASNPIFKTIAVSGQSDVVADSATDTLTLAAGTGMTITTDANTDTITFDASNPIFKTIAVSGQSDVVADSTTDTLTLAAGTGMTITTDANTDTITFNASGGSSKWTDSANLLGIYRNSNVAINSTAACSHALRVEGVIHTLGANSVNGIIFDDDGASPVQWQMNSATDFHIKRGNGSTCLKIGNSTGTWMFPNGICLNGTTTYDINDTMYDYEIGVVSRNSVTLSNSASGGSVVYGSTHLDSGLSNTYTYVRSGDMVNLSFQFKIINTANLTSGSFIYLSVPFVPVTNNISTGVINILTPAGTGASNYNAQLQHGYAFLTGGSRLGFAYNQDGASATSFTLAHLYGATIRGNIVYKTA